MDHDTDLTRQEYLNQANELVRLLEAGDEDGANSVLERLTKLRERDLFQQLGRLTRELHEALTNFAVDSRMADMAEKDIPDAKDRLNYVVSMTDQAANRTMDLIDQAIPLSDELQQRAEVLTEKWGRLRRREMSASEFSELAREMEEYFEVAHGNSVQLRSQLSDMMVAQDFQDLTGQVIRRVIELVQEVEERLVGLLRITGDHLEKEGTKTVSNASTTTAATIAISGTGTEPAGPAVPGVDEGDVVQGQDEVDDLLSSLGF